MGFIESDGDNDFASIFQNLADAKRDQEERRQVEMFLGLLEEIESKRKQPGRRMPFYPDVDEEEELAAFREFQRRRRQQQQYPMRTTLPKEYLRVSITGDDEHLEKNKQDETKRRREREALVRKIHTIDDLPQDDLFFMPFQSGPAFPEDEFHVEKGRRLKDGRIEYNTVFPEWFEELWVSLYPYRFELLFIAILVFTLITILFMRIASKIVRLFMGPRQQEMQQQQHFQPILQNAGMAGSYPIMVVSPSQLPPELLASLKQQQ